MKRFDIVIADFLAHESDRVYHSNGEFVEAEVAQDLLEALEMMVAECSDDHWAPHVAAAREAIAKATGVDHEQTA